MELIMVGNNIRRLRKEAKMTQERLAEKLDVSPQAISKWENGYCLPETQILPRLARLLNSSIDDILLFVELDESKINEQKTIIIEPKIIRKGEIVIAGVLGDGNKTAYLWSKYETLKQTNPIMNKKEDYGYELRLYSNNGSCECLVGACVKNECKDSLYKYIMLPDVLYAVFEIYPYKGYESQNAEMDKWLSINKNNYKQLKLDNKDYVIEFYDERFKGNEDPDSLLEIWIPIIKV